MLLFDLHLHTHLIFVEVMCPEAECLLGDKLTAFAPRTTGFQYGANKEREIIEQLYDLGLLFDLSADLHLAAAEIRAIAAQELEHRNLPGQSHYDVLGDCFTYLYAT